MDNDDTAVALPNNVEQFFPLPQIRPKQAKCLDFIHRMLSRGVTDIVISAPTGFGKSAVAAAVGFWAAQPGFQLPGDPGAYLLCTQKMLQDQYEGDILRYAPHLRSAVSLKTASEYECKQHGNCGAGLAHKPICRAVKDKNCTYIRQKAAFLRASVAITNYPFFFTERVYQESFPSRKLLALDECHSLESQLFKFIELVVGPKEVEKFTPTLGQVPAMKGLAEFGAWLDLKFCPTLKARLDAFDPNHLTPARAKEKQEIEQQLSKALRAIEEFEADRSNWIFWQEQEPSTVGPVYTAIAKPLSAARYFNDLIRDTSHARIYLSAYPGTKGVFCRTIGLDPTRVAVLTLGAIFPKENRPIHATLLGSMSRKNQADTMPSLLRFLAKLLEVHNTEKGIWHGHSYALCELVFAYFKTSPHSHRILFPRCADERADVYEKHRNAKIPTVILSPSFTEGFDFIDENARWQVILKTPFPFLGDKQVLAKKDADPEWYAFKTVSTIIQACGRIVRTETDTGTTYIVDRDFEFLYDKWNHLFPSWWQEALVTH